MRRMIALIAPFAIAALVGLSPATAQAQDFKLTIKDHKFSPEEIKVPANTRVIITIVNEDASAEEFDRSALKVEKVVAGKSSGTVRIGPLKPGRYPFIGEFHEATAKGVVIAE